MEFALGLMAGMVIGAAGVLFSLIIRPLRKGEEMKARKKEYEFYYTCDNCNVFGSVKMPYGGPSVGRDFVCPKCGVTLIAVARKNG